MNTENLLKLATYLLSGDTKAKFSMAIFADRLHLNGFNRTCGTIGCAVGHGPYAGIEKWRAETWYDYSFRVFLIVDKTSAWHWCFSNNWESTDNTPEGAGKRILYMLRHGIPEDWYEQLIGAAELIYLNETL